MYKAPINIYTSTFIPSDVIKQQEANIYKAVVNSGVSVDKEELLHALQYDRAQYNKGYQDGKADAVVHGQWKFWEGWMSNHDMRIDDATCSICGYEHPTVRRTYGIRETEQEVLNKLFKFCPNCGTCMDSGDNVSKEDNCV